MGSSASRTRQEAYTSPTLSLAGSPSFFARTATHSRSLVISAIGPKRGHGRLAALRPASRLFRDLLAASRGLPQRALGARRHRGRRPADRFLALGERAFAGAHGALGLVGRAEPRLGDGVACRLRGLHR